MKLIHTADWHLCSPMECRLPREKAEQRRAELLSRFAELVSQAEDEGVCAVLLCGDFSDDGVLPHHIQDYLLSLIEDAAPIRFFMIAGNHDRISAGTVGGCFTAGRRQLPDNLYVFGDAWSSVTLADGVMIHGRSLTQNAEVPDLPDLPGNCYNIVMLHGEISDTSAMLGGDGETVPLGALRGHNIDYLALGHEHTFRHGRLDARGTWCYPGCPEGRGFDECGRHGYVVLELDGTHCRGASFVPFAARMLHDLRLDVSAIDGGLYAVEQALGALVRDIARDDLVRVTLCGTDTLTGVLDLRYLSSRLHARFFYAELRDRRTVGTSVDDAADDVSLRGAFIRAVSDAELSDEERAAVLRCGLAALGGRADETFPRGGDTE